MKERRLYIAYASNLDTFQMEKICPSASIDGTAEINGYRLVFRGGKNSACATIEPSDGDNVPVLVWELEKTDEQALDQQFSPVLYRKEMMEIYMYPSLEEMYEGYHADGELVDAIVYIMNGGKEINMLSADYLNTILDGYDEAGFDPTAIENALEISQEYALRNNRSIDPQSGFDSNL